LGHWILGTRPRSCNPDLQIPCAMFDVDWQLEVWNATIQSLQLAQLLASIAKSVLSI